MRLKCTYFPLPDVKADGLAGPSKRGRAEQEGEVDHKQ